MVLCPFWKESRAHFAVRECDNLVEGMPDCVKEDFYPDNTDSYEDESPPPCPHITLSDLFNPKVKNGCYFGNDECNHPNIEEFLACKDCEKWLKK